ncbi:ATP-grasp domain-containing protein [Clostridium cochlearium]|uniref:ATP-grasp domain-containing protein n=1 Tax=Clostridium cochlearium TaxID=1494 RepID=UPI00156DA4EF|nr:ATP-grasp domain-containing protein [Clostridium cochlearium]MBV1817959.1 ATP-grasp domain-containing protein [Bacteroidales bacterium MSK.15.36]MCG4571350.1 ATP-grasp domain-containing protein [Clostridium cochlearium]MCG4580009.1 ATP-grasp domain-containing protein [Clostridium cochlearium]NSJ90591.1 ATP-grasp domain-containing protein [Coprococcus sp. MSK.21.13]
MGGDIPNKIIVLGGAHHNGLGIVRSLGEVGNSVYFISVDSERNFVTKSKYIKKWWSVSGGKLLEFLKTKFKSEVFLPILIPSDDYTANLLDLNRDSLKHYFLFPHVKNLEFRLLELMNKDVLSKIAKKHGFKIPRSKVIDLSVNNDAITNVVENNIGFPCIVKPAQSVEGSKSDILIIENDNQLHKAIAQYRKKYLRVFVQQYINKKGEVGIQGISMYNSNEVYIAGVVRKIRVSKVAPGSTTYAELDSKFDLHSENKIISMLKDIGFSGIFDVELMYDAKDIYFIEINFRNGAYGYAFTKAGVNLPYIWCREVIGFTYNNISRIKKSKILMSEFADFRNVLYKNISLVQWILEFIKTDFYLILNISDLKPFFYKLIY